MKITVKVAEIGLKNGELKVKGLEVIKEISEKTKLTNKRNERKNCKCFFILKELWSLTKVIIAGLIFEIIKRGIFPPPEIMVILQFIR